MKRAKTTTEAVSATIKGNGKTIVDEVIVELNTEKFSLEHQVSHGSFKLSLDRPLLPGFYQLVLKDGRSYRIVVKGVHIRGEQSLVRFLVVPEE